MGDPLWIEYRVIVILFLRLTKSWKRL